MRASSQRALDRDAAMGQRPRPARGARHRALGRHSRRGGQGRAPRASTTTLARAADGPPRSRTTCTRGCARRCSTRASTRSSPPGGGARGRERRADDRHHRHRVRASRWLQPARARRAVLATRAPARSTSTRPRRSRRTRRARWRARLPGAAAGDLRRRHAARASAPRSAARANLVLTNPDMLHVGILPNHRRGATCSANLAAVVVDEAHVYRGVFGSHVANVLRRLRRVATPTGPTPRFLLASATIANPVELAERLTGLEDFALVDRDGVPRPRERESRSGTRRCSTRPSARAARRSARRPTCSPSSSAGGARTICFMKSRKAVELMSRFAAATALEERAARARRAPRALPRRLHARAAARARAPARLRRAARRRRDRRARARHRHRRARRRPRASRSRARSRRCARCGAARAAAGAGFAVYVAGEDALDQFFCRHPDEFLGPAGRGGDPRPRERADLRRTCCAPRTRAPLDRRRRRAARAALAGARATRSCRRGELRVRRRPLRRAARRGLPGGATSRCAPPRADAFAVVDAQLGRAARDGRGGARVLAPSTRARSTSTWAAPTRCSALDLDAAPRARAAVRRATGTRSPSARPTRDRAAARPARGTRRAAELRARRPGHRAGRRLPAALRPSPGPAPGIDLIALDLPETPFATQALWYELADDAAARDAAARATCSARCTPPSTRRSRCCRCWPCATAGTSAACRPTCTRRRGRPTIFIYDGHPGGVGHHAARLRALRRARRDAHRLVAECPCQDGCPSCVQSPKCGNLNEPLDKAGSVELMRSLLAVAGPAPGDGPG